MSIDTPFAHLKASKIASVRLAELAYRCIEAREPSRELDAKIARAVFPELQKFVMLTPGVWVHPDGRRVRALHYSGSFSAAASLVPAGDWFEEEAAPRHTISVHSHRLSQAPASATHGIAALALAAAALLARAQYLQPES
jgi:hypothetical protein